MEEVEHEAHVIGQSKDGTEESETDMKSTEELRTGEEIFEQPCKTNDENKTKTVTPFKKPILIGKIGKLPRKISIKNITESEKVTSSDSQSEIENKDIEISTNSDTPVEIKVKPSNEKPIKAPAQQLTENLVPLPYKEPSWSGLPRTSDKEYTFEVLKSGVIVEQINLMSKPFWVFGRSTNCEIYMAHPTISRYHAVLQYRKEGTPEEPSGFYIYDLSSTHGTFLNKGRLKSRVYAPVKVGHMLKLGFSTRSYVLTGPEDDTEEESKYSITELRQQRAEKLMKQELAEKEALLREEKEREDKRKRDEERGVDWGLGEDADEDSDLPENPYAQTNNEELYVEDPKKALRGFMEREGYNLEYDCTEQGFGQFLCKVELPLDDECGRPIVAEVLHKGKKKEAVIQCALEACRILDRHGVLRQATHESRKRKAKNWEENDYYDSDDDTFLDRTGVIEKKREKRMKAKVPQQPETYQSLMEKEKKISTEIAEIEKQLSKAKATNANQSSTEEEDSLESFMKELKDSKPDKQTISKLKTELAALKVEHAQVVKFVNLVKPADLPPLVISNKSSNDQPESSGSSKTKSLPLFGKRLKIKLQVPVRSSMQDVTENMNVEEDEEEPDVEDEKEDKSVEEARPENIELSSSAQEQAQSTNADNNSASEDKDRKVASKLDNIPCYLKVYRQVTELEKLMSEHKFPSELEQHVEEVRLILQEVKDLTEREGRIQSDKKIIMAKNRKVKKHIENLLESYDEHHLMRICKEIRRIYGEIQDTTEKQHMISAKIRILGMKIELVCREVLKEIKRLKRKSENADLNTKRLQEGNNSTETDDTSAYLDDEDEKDENKLTPDELEKRKKKNQRRIQQRKERIELEKQRGYQEDARKEDYNMWVPPKNQTGDGRTSLNEKYGY